MTLNKLQRIGIVLSVVWALGAGLYQRSHDMNAAQSMMNMTFQTCSDNLARQGNFEFASCMDKAEKVRLVFMEGSWENAAIVALIPIPLGWLFAFLVIRVYRWIASAPS